MDISLKFPHSCRKACIAACFAFSALAGWAQVDADQVVNIGRNVLSMDDYMLAIHYFNQAIKAKPYLSDPYFYRAIAKLSLEDYKGAEEDCSIALQNNKFKIEAYKVRGFARQCLGNDSLAISDYDIGLQYNPIDKYFLFYKAVALTELSQFNQADSVFATLLRQYPRFDEGFTARGRLNIERGDTTEAIADLDRAISISKGQINPYLMKAEIAWKRKDWDQAGSNLDAAIRLRPEVADLYVNRAFVRYNSDDFFGAMSDYNYALELEPHNTSALFNRALLRYEVRDLTRANEDLSEVLNLDPQNFHALYNRGLIRLELKNYKEALADFNEIAKKYPKFYLVYYAMAEARREMGEMRQAMQLAHHADELIKRYVANPEKNALDRPTIAAAVTKDARRKDDADDESEIEVMEKFNRLVTVSDAVESHLTYNEKIRGRVQDRNVNVDAEPIYALSFSPAPLSLRSVSNYFRELDLLNGHQYINRQFYLVPGNPSSGDEEATERLFKYAEDLDKIAQSGSARPIDFLAAGVAYTELKNYPAAIERLNRAISLNDEFTVAYMARAFAKFSEAVSKGKSMEETTSPGSFLDRKSQLAAMQDAISDYDKALTLNPRLVFAWFNKGDIFYYIGDFTSAIQCFSEAIKTDPEFGQAYFNRGLAYLRSGNKRLAFIDLSKAGELGVLSSYNILKRMK